MSSSLHNFYKNFPLNFIRRNKDHKLTNLPASINDARNQILSKTWNHPNTKEDEYANYVANHLYLFAIGNFNYENDLIDDPESRIISLKNAHRISESSCGFVSDILIKERRDFIKMSIGTKNQKKKSDFEIDLKNASFHETLRFCFSHEMYIGHDIESEELKSMAKWIIRNENEGVSFSHFSTLMQQAIDMSVLAQHAAKMGPENDAHKNRLNQISNEALSMMSQIQKQNSSIQHKAGLLLNTVSFVGDQKPIYDFQSKVLDSHIESQLQIEQKISQNNINSNSNSSSMNAQEENSNNE